jgi:hypothetical protein
MKGKLQGVVEELTARLQRLEALLSSRSEAPKAP